MAEPQIDPSTGLPRRSSNPWPIVLIVLGACGGLAIIGVMILAAVLFPVFGQAREAARKASCMSNVKRLSVSLLIYSQDYDTMLPPSDRWQDLASAAYTATSSDSAADPVHTNCPTRAGIDPGYALNSKVGGKYLSAFKDPDAAPLIFESSLGKKNSHDTLESFVTPHAKSGLVGFVDGSVRALQTAPSATAGMAPP